MRGVHKPLTVKQILRWADGHHRVTGRWPTSRCGVVLNQPDRTWEGVNTALRKGTCGMPGGDSLNRLLERHRGKTDLRVAMPDLTLKQVLKWADSHRAITGRWPWRECGPVLDCPGISWATIDSRMGTGEWELPRGTTLAKWLLKVRDVWDGGKPRLTEALVVRWAQEHFDRTGRWPVTMSGPVQGHPGENWAAIDVAIRNKRRGFPQRSSLRQILRSRFGAAYDSSIGPAKFKQPAPNVRVIKVDRRRLVAR
jgi:hypothetical protein